MTVEVIYVNQLKPQSTLKQSTKVCDCGNTVLVLLTSLNKKYCIDCQKYIDWYLAEGQKSPLTSVIGGPSTPIIQDPTPTVESLPAGATMNLTTFYVPINNVTEDQIRQLCAAFCNFHKVEIPEEFIQQVLTYKELVPNSCIEITHRPLSIALAVNNSNKQIININICTAIYENINELPDDLFAEEPEPVMPQSNTVTVKEAALEYQKLYNLVIQTANRLGIKPIKGTRLDNMHNVLHKLEENFSSKTLH